MVCQIAYPTANAMGHPDHQFMCHGALQGEQQSEFPEVGHVDAAESRIGIVAKGQNTAAPGGLFGAPGLRPRSIRFVSSTILVGWRAERRSIRRN